MDADGNEQALPEKPALLESGIPDEVAAAAEQARRKELELQQASDRVEECRAELERLQQAQQEAAATPDTSDDGPAAQAVADAQAAFDAAQAELNALLEQSAGEGEPNTPNTPNTQDPPAE